MRDVSDRLAQTSVPIHELLAQRWSPRVLDSAAEISETQLRALFEAARWAPSWGNTQPARYIVGRRGEETFDKILATLTKSNQLWATPSSALIVGVAVTMGTEGEPLPYAEYGLGLATQNLVLQAIAEGFVAHQMAGFDRSEIRAAFSLPQGVEPLVVISVGQLGEFDTADERLVAKDTAPRVRKPLSELVFTAEWGGAAF